MSAEKQQFEKMLAQVDAIARRAAAKLPPGLSSGAKLAIDLSPRLVHSALTSTDPEGYWLGFLALAALLCKCQVGEARALELLESCQALIVDGPGAPPEHLAGHA